MVSSVMPPWVTVTVAVAVASVMPPWVTEAVAVLSEGERSPVAQWSGSTESLLSTNRHRPATNSK